MGLCNFDGMLVKFILFYGFCCNCIVIDDVVVYVKVFYVFSGLVYFEV